MRPIESGDSAGQPWTGRHFGDNAHADDDGRPPAPLLDALARFASHDAGAAVVVEALRASRLLIPLVARPGAPDRGEREIGSDWSQVLSIVAVAGPDGRTVLPVFTSVDTMRAWNALARPVPASAQRVALAAVSEGIELVVIDPASDTEFALRRPVVWAIAQSKTWISPSDDSQVAHAFESSVGHESRVLGVHLFAGDPDARLRGPELIIRVRLVPGLKRPELDALTARLRHDWSRNTVIAHRVDSLRIEAIADTGPEPRAR